MSEPLLLTEIDYEVPFHDVDAMKIVWHGHYIKYFELVRTVLLRKLNYDLPQMEASSIGWPVIECKCRYIQPLLYGMKLKIQAWVSEVEFRLKVEYRIFNADTGERLTKGYTIQAAVQMPEATLIGTEHLQGLIQTYLDQNS